jgi:hypothetical protein
MTGNEARFSCPVRCHIYEICFFSVLHLPKALSLKKQILTMKGAETNTWNVPLLELPQGKISEGNDRGNERRSSYFFSLPNR